MIYPKMLGSSVDPAKLSLTIKGILIGLVPVIIIIAKGFDVDLNNDELNQTIEAIVAVIVNIGLFSSSVMFAFGLIRKVVNKFKK